MSQEHETMVRTYKSAKEYNKDAKKLAKQGWVVINSMEHQPPSGIGRKMTIGFGALVFKPKKELIVTYSRPKK